MTIDGLSLASFKNIESAQLAFSPKINCFLGRNGMGKSNLLDALYFLSYTKSFSGLTDAQLIRRGDGFAMLRGHYSRRGLDEELSAALRPGRRKSFRRGGKEYKRLSEHIGAFPLVLLSPADMELTAGAAEERRRCIDQILSQDDPRYLDALQRYSQGIDQRNRLLRDECTDRGLFDAVETQLDIYGTYLTSRRRVYIDRLRPIFEKYYSEIGGERESVGIGYVSQLEASGAASLSELFERNRRRDAILHHSSSGPHRDDIEMTLEGMPVRRCASQGQTKTFTSALRFAQYELLKESLGISPLLLLDDIFDKLDAERVQNIMSLVASSGVFGQIFITDTNRKHLDEILRGLPAGSSDAYRIWDVDGGAFKAI